MRISDWSSDVCSSDLPGDVRGHDDRTAPRHGGDRHPDHARLSVFGGAAQGARGRVLSGGICQGAERSEERRVGKKCVVRVDLGGGRFIKKQTTTKSLNTYTHT